MLPRRNVDALWLAVAVPGVPPNDLQVRTSLGVKF
jgi:hypothetical protein